MHNDQRSAGLVLQSMSVHGNNFHSPQLSPSLLPGHAGSSLVASPARQRGRNRPSSATSKKHCNCKNSRCLKLYCECFASGRYCDGCNCVNCCNNMENEATRQSAVEAILERNPNAFRPKIQAGASEEGLAAGNARHNKGCNCKKSGCLKKYCECFQAGIYCGDNCKCIDCKNFEGSEAREAVAMTAFQPQDMPTRHHQPLPHHSPAQNNKRQRLAPTHSMHRQPHPPLPSIPVNTRQPLPAIPEMVSRGMQQGSRSRMGQARGDPRTQAINNMSAGAQLGGPLGAALSIRPNAPQQTDGYFRDTMHEMFKRGGIDEVCALLVSVAQEQAEPSSSSGPNGQSAPQAATDSALLPSLTAQGQLPDGSLQPSSVTTDGADLTTAAESGNGVSKLYEAQERAVLSEYHEVLLKLVDRATQKQKDAQQQQQQALPRPSRDLGGAPAASRPLSAPATLADGPQQHIMHGNASQDLDASSAFEQLQQSRLLPQQQPQQLQQQQRQLAAASQPPAGAAYIPDASSSFLAQNRFGGNSSAGIHLPLGVSHLESNGYLSNPGPSGLTHPVQTGMGLPGQLGFGSAQAMGLGHPVQTGMGSPSHSTGLYQRPASAQPLGSRQSMQAGLHVRPGSHIGGMSNPLGPNQQHPSNGPSSEGLRQNAQLPPMQLPVGSMLTNAPIETMSHLPAQLQTQRHLQQQLPNSRLYQSFSDALAEPSQTLNGPSMHSMVSHAPSQSLYTQHQQPQGLVSSSQSVSAQPQTAATQQLPPHMHHLGQGFSTQPQNSAVQQTQPLMQASSSMHHLGQAFSMQPQGSATQQPQSHEQTSSSMHHLGQGLSSQALSKAADAGSSMHSSAGLVLPSGAALLPSLPDGSAQVSAHFPGSLSASLQEQ